jgi:hypothetical protein
MELISLFIAGATFNIFKSMSCFSSKYMGGHTDLIAGCVTVAHIEHWTALKEHLATTGSTLVCYTFIDEFFITCIAVRNGCIHANSRT